MTELYCDGINLDYFRTKYNATTFVETGCWVGNSLSYVRGLGFTKMYSCDINLDCVTKSQALVPEAVIHHSDSITFLENILPTITERTVFWLDAHFPGHYGLPDTERTLFPLAEELELIKSLKPSYQHDVIMFDDVHVLKPDNNPKYNPGLPPYYRINKTVNELTDIFSTTHDYTIIPVFEGVLVLFPKN